MTFTDTATKVEPKVETHLVTMMKALHDAEKKAESKYFPLIEEAIEMRFTGNKDPAEVRRIFCLAYAKAIKVDWKEYEKTPDYVSFRARMHQVVTIAEKGRDWYDALRKDKIGFLSMHKQATETVSEESNPKPSKAKGTAKGKTKAYAKAKEAGTADEEEYEPLGNDKWKKLCLMIAQGEPEEFIKMLEYLIREGAFPDKVGDQDIMPTIAATLRGE